MRQPFRSRTEGAWTAVGLTVVASVLRWLLSSHVGDRDLLLLFLLPVVVAAWRGGLRPGLFATMLGAMAGGYWYVRPIGSFVPDQMVEWLGLALFVASGVISSWTFESLIRSRERALDFILQRERAEHALRDSESRLAAILQQLPVGVGVMDTRGRWILANPVLRAFVPDWTPTREPQRTSRWQAFDDAGNPIPREEWPGPRALRGETVSPGQEMLVREENGKETWTRVSTAPLRDENGEIAGAIAMVQNIDALKRADVAQREADRRKDEFLAILAHELRNPLAPVYNAARILKVKGGDNPDLQRPIEMIERQVGQMARLVEDLVDVSRISRGMVELRPEPVPFAEIIESAVDACSGDVEARRHTLTVGLPEEPVTLRADRNRLIQLFCNLIVNAAKYTPELGDIVISAHAEGQMLEVHVRDSGVGIPPSKLGEIFELFSRVEPTSGRPGGLGVGLTLARRLTELHGGTIEARSEGIGHGSTFVVRLPIATAPPIAPPQREPDLALEPRSILVVDDDIDGAESMALVLRMAGHTVRVAYDGPDAVATAAEMIPDVAFLDIAMPGMDGYEVARRIRGEPWGQSVYLVALTGWGQESDRTRSREVGLNAHLVKPVSHDVLRRLLQSVPAPAESATPEPNGPTSSPAHAARA